MTGTLLPLLAGLLGVAAAGFLGIPGGTFTGAMAGAAAVRLLSGRAKEPPKRLQLFARMLLGLTIGVSVNEKTINAISESALPVLLMLGILIGLSFLTAWVVTRTSGMPFITALCSSAPGAATAMVILAGDLDGDRPLVAMMHILRLSAIVMMMPVVMAAFHARGVDGSAVLAAVGPAASGTAVRYGKMAVLVLAGIPVTLLFRRLRVPAAEILAGIVAAAVLNPAVLHLEGLPRSWQIVSQWIIGAGIGSQITKKALRSMKAYMITGLIMTSVLIGIGFLLGWLLYLTTSMDLMTALIGSCPGALEAMVILAGDMNADVQLVAAMHTARLVVVLLVVPLIVKRAIRPREAESPL